MDTRTKEAVRYLGYGKCAIDERTLALVQESFKELEEIADVKFIYRIFELSHLDADEIKLGNMIVKSKSLCKNLKDCKEAFLLGITLGTEVDRRMRKYELVEMSRAVVFQAAAAAFLEERCDELQEKLAKERNQIGEYLRPRFSPGYGDFSILHQKEILTMLDAAKHIGLTMTEGYMLTPTKSVTAVIGVSDKEESCNPKGCTLCAKTDCLYRRS